MAVRVAAARFPANGLVKCLACSLRQAVSQIRHELLDNFSSSLIDRRRRTRRSVREARRHYEPDLCRALHLPISSEKGVIHAGLRSPARSLNQKLRPLGIQIPIKNNVL